MRKDAIQIEEARLQGINEIEDYTSLHERHRIFPAVFESRQHKRILDVAAGVGVVGKRIKEYYQADPLCNDISQTCLRTMEKIGLETISFDIDDDEKAFPFPDNHFDTVISLATVEHLIHIDHFMEETYRILSDEGCLYISAPNYSGLTYLVPFLLSGKTFHDPLSEDSRYEFYAHVRYFTYDTMVEFTKGFGFVPDTVYLAIPEGSSRYLSLKSKSRSKALAYRHAMKFIYRFFSPRWAPEPVICFRKTRDNIKKTKIRKIVL